ncbi:MAG TPA: class II fructose-bisphosphate aldolase [Candidatus Parcubacteria bacterium]|nr:class II fructose-bisphosphate aldolase [Candidatus Parcubacteria bacterium]
MTLKHYLQKAQKENWAIGQFNFSTLEQLRGILAAAAKLESPVILGTSHGESQYLGIREIIALVEISKMKYKVPAFLNLDHAKDFQDIKTAIDYGYPGVHFDGSDLPLEKNIEYAKKVMRYARKKNVLVEGEVGAIGTESSKIYRKFKLNKSNLTKPEDAERFVKETGVDSLAISIGNFHGVKTKGKNPRLQIERLREIKERTGNTFLVLHGGSGTRDDDIRKAISAGIVKININTELRLAYANGIKKNFQKRNPEIAPYKYLFSAMEAVQKKVEEKIKLFGSVGKI